MASLLYPPDVGLRPGGDHARRVHGIAPRAQQVVGPIERNEALGMPRRHEDAGRIADVDRRIAWRMHDEERLPQPADPRGEILLRYIGEELALDFESSSGELDFGLAVRFDFRHAIGEKPGDMARIARRCNGDHGL